MPSANVYGISRKFKRTTGDNRAWYWFVLVKRQGKAVRRAFPDLTYGSEAAAFQMAQAYHEAVIRLLPPKTKHQFTNTLYSSNTSGIAGVRRQLVNGYAYWVASHKSNGQKHTKAFSIAHYGEEQAQAMAIAEREAYVRSNPNCFMVWNAQATEAAETLFGDLLQAEPVFLHDLPPVSDVAPPTMEFLIEALDAWFDTLLPGFVQVHLAIYSRMPNILKVTVRNGRKPTRAKITVLSVRSRSFAQAMQLAWEFVQNGMIELHGSHCWEDFQSRHRATFFAFDSACDPLNIRYRYLHPGYDALRRPPEPLLATLLPGFEIPPLK